MIGRTINGWYTFQWSCWMVPTVKLFRKASYLDGFAGFHWKINQQWRISPNIIKIDIFPLSLTKKNPPNYHQINTSLLFVIKQKWIKLNDWSEEKNCLSTSWNVCQWIPLKNRHPVTGRKPPQKWSKSTQCKFIITFSPHPRKSC